MDVTLDVMTATEKSLIVKQNSPCQHLRKCIETVWRMCILMLGCKLSKQIHALCCLTFLTQFDELPTPVAQEVEFIFIRLNVLREVR